MAQRTESISKDSRLHDGYIYLVAGLAAATGAILATHRLVFDVQLLGVLLPLAVALVVVGPVLMGYTQHSFLAGILTGVMPAAGAYVSVLAWPPFDPQRIETMVTMALVGTGLALPFVAGLFIIGVGLRRDGSLAEQKRELAIRVLAAILVSALLLLISDIGFLQTFGDQ